MARLNAKRRRERALMLARKALADSLNPTTQPESGFVRNTHKARVLNQMVPAVARAAAPRPLNFDASGRRIKRPRKVWSAT